MDPPRVTPFGLPRLLQTKGYMFLQVVYLKWCPSKNTQVFAKPLQPNGGAARPTQRL